MDDIVTTEQIAEWLRIDPTADKTTIDLLVASGVDIVSHQTNRILVPHINVITGEVVMPIVPAALKHAIAVFVSSHFDDRSGDTSAAMKTISRLCAPYWVPSL